MITWNSFLLRHFTCWLSLLVGSAVMGSAAQPNVIVIVADDLGYGDLSCYGGTIPTPHIDRLASQGMRFTDFHANGPMCSPTRAAFLTGRYQQRSGIESALDFDQKGLPPQPTLASRLKQSGYITGIFGKWHLGSEAESLPLAMGFDEYKGLLSGDGDHHSQVDRRGVADWWEGNRPLAETGYTTELVTRHARDFISRHRNDSFFLYVPHLAVHFPWQGPSDHADRVVGTDYRKGTLKFGTQPDKKATYRQMVQALDGAVGELMDHLHESGLEKNTLIIFFSDNGGYTLDQNGYVGVSSNGPLRGQKGDLYEGGHRVPAIAWWPGRIPAGAVTDATVMTVDLFPTILDLAGARRAQEVLGLDGITLWPLLTQDQLLPERKVFMRMRKDKFVREGNWKLVINQDGTQLFDLRSDLGETRDRSASESGRVEAMKAALVRWEAEVDASYQALAGGKLNH